MPKQRERSQGTIGAFWETHPVVYNIKQIISGIVEFCFLTGALRALVLERQSECEEDGSLISENIPIEKIRFCLMILLVLHILYCIRLIYKMCMRTNKKFKGRQGLCKCLIVDSYGCIGFTAYAYTQITYVFYFKACEEQDELPKTHQWLMYEFIYQYSQIGVYLITNCCVLGVMLFQQKRQRDEKHALKGNLEEDQDLKKKSSRLSKIIRRRHCEQFPKVKREQSNSSELGLRKLTSLRKKKNKSPMKKLKKDESMEEDIVEESDELSQFQSEDERDKPIEDAIAISLATPSQMSQRPLVVSHNDIESNKGAASAQSHYELDGNNHLMHFEDQSSVPGRHYIQSVLINRDDHDHQASNLIQLNQSSATRSILKNSERKRLQVDGVSPFGFVKASIMSPTSGINHSKDTEGTQRHRRPARISEDSPIQSGRLYIDQEPQNNIAQLRK